MLLAADNQEWNLAVKPSLCLIIYKQFRFVGSFSTCWRSVECAEAAGGCGACLWESRGMRKALHSQRRAVEDGQGRSPLFHRAEMRVNNTQGSHRGEENHSKLAGTKSMVARYRSSAAHLRCAWWAWIRSMLSSPGAAQPAELSKGSSGLRKQVPGGEQTWGWGRRVNCDVSGYFIDTF